MARIRSVHPGLFTDEAFVQLSPSAQIFWIGLLTESDDHGVFEWKPVTLKMRLLPLCDGSVEPLLQELVDQGLGPWRLLARRQRRRPQRRQREREVERRRKTPTRRRRI
jgi:hypothetical protein